LVLWFFPQWSVSPSFDTIMHQGEPQVLVDRRNFWKLHGRWFIGTAITALIAVAWTVWTGSRNSRWPGGGSLSGLVLGITAGIIFVFEMSLAAKKTPAFRTVRWLGSAQTWMQAHIWLGLLTVPLVILHSGGRLGGTLTTLFVVVVAVVIVSGLWGLALQNWLPTLLLDAAPAETIYSQIDSVGRQYANEAHRLVTLACGASPEDVTENKEPLEVAAAVSRTIHGAPRPSGPPPKRSPHPARDLPVATPAPAVRAALRDAIEPYLRTGVSESKLLGSRQRNQWFFEDLRLRVPPELRDLVVQLEELCERRRQLNVQRRLHFWLHNWLWVHLPLSALLLILLLGHIVFALRFD
jgi:hypothetical protein